MKKTTLAKAALMAATALVAVPAATAAEKTTGWGDYKLYLDPGHAKTENQGLWGYSEAEKVLQVALNIKDMLLNLTDMDEANLKLCRYTDQDQISLEERSDEANAWGADFYYSIHSDASATSNTIVTLFGGWRKAGVEIEKTPNGGKAYGEFLEPNLSGVMRIGSRGNWHDRCFYDRQTETHANQYPYLSVNRRSNMPSLLSEGGYHTIAEQQQRNINKDYKRLEAFAAFQSLLQYRGLERPNQTFLTGMVTNSENGQPLNGATVTVDGKTYTTDTYESAFQRFTKNPNLIHNGFYMFEGLEAGKEYDVTYAAQGFEPQTVKLTIKAGGTTTADYVTFSDIALTNNMPAKVDAISLDDVNNVSPNYPLVITFSRNMDTKSVEEALTVNNGGQVALSWINNYTLSVDISALEPLWGYTIKIDGNIARNSQTNQAFDGDGDGIPGGDYILDIMMAEPDVEAPYVVSTYPADGGEALFVSRPPIRLEFNEVIDWNADKHSELLTVKDADGNQIYGSIDHVIIRDASVVTFYPTEDLPNDKAILVSLKPGVADLSGNAFAGYGFRFLTEYRGCTSKTVIHPFLDTTDMWAPNGSGSTSGLVDDANTVQKVNVSPFLSEKSSMGLTYAFDENFAAENWFIREYNPRGSNIKIAEAKGFISLWVYGDGSNNLVGPAFRNTVDNGITYRMMPIDFRGWKLYVWDLENDTDIQHLTGNTAALGKFYMDAINIRHYYTDPDDEDIAQMAWSGDMAFHALEHHTWDTSNERQADIEDVKIPDYSGVATISTDNDAPVRYYDLRGIRVSGNNPGMYIRIQGNKATKVLVK